MKQKKLIALVLALCCLAGAAAAQTGPGHLRSWAGKYPTTKKGRVTSSFFNLPEIRRPLLKLLKRSDYNLLTRAYQVETPIKEIGDYLAVKVCRPHNCDEEQGAFAINLKTGFVYVRMEMGATVRWFVSQGDQTDLPSEVQEYLGDFSAT